MENHLVRAFRNFRPWRNGNGYHPASVALAKARGLIWNQVWGGKGPQGGYASPWAAPYWRANGLKRDPGAALYVGPGDLESHGLRFIDYSDKLLDRMRHTGWHSRFDYYDSAYRGCVLQLPGRKGESRFIAAYEESDSGGYVLDLSRGAVFVSPRETEGYEVRPRDQDAARDAARAADSFAEREAEEAREYDTAWQAGRRWAELKEEEAAERKAALVLAGEARALRVKVGPDEAPTVCASLRREIRAAWRSITKSRGEREELARGDREGFYFYPSDELKGAFCEGASLKAFPA